MEDRPGAERFETVIIGGGQAGLATGYFLKQAGRPLRDPGRRRTRRGRLADPLGLPSTVHARALRWPAGVARSPRPAWSFPTKDEMADYLEAYVGALRPPGPQRASGWIASRRRATGSSITAGRPAIRGRQRRGRDGRVPGPEGPRLRRRALPGHRRSSIRTTTGALRSSRDGDVLVVGVGNSGAEIAKELSQSHRTLLAGKESGHIPVRHGSIAARFGFRVFRFLGHRVLTQGHADRAEDRAQARSPTATPSIRVKPKDLAAAGVERVPRVAGVEDGLPVLEDGRVLDVANVIWCTGFRSDFGWIDLPVFGEDGEPIHDRGSSSREPGLYFIGLVVPVLLLIRRAPRHVSGSCLRGEPHLLARRVRPRELPSSTRRGEWTVTHRRRRSRRRRRDRTRTDRVLELAFDVGSKEIGDARSPSRLQRAWSPGAGSWGRPAVRRRLDRSRRVCRGVATAVGARARARRRCRRVLVRDGEVSVVRPGRDRAELPVRGARRHRSSVTRAFVVPRRSGGSSACRSPTISAACSPRRRSKTSGSMSCARRHAERVPL